MLDDKADSFTCCFRCGSLRVQHLAWIDDNTDEILDRDVSSDEDTFCPACDGHEGLSEIDAKGKTWKETFTPPDRCESCGVDMDWTEEEATAIDGLRYCGECSVEIIRQRVEEDFERRTFTDNPVDTEDNQS